MTTYIALLRGINVSGHNKIKMVDLKQLFIDIGFLQVTTYIQSGNVVFMSEEKNSDTLENIITEKIKKHFGYQLKVFILTRNEIKTVYNSNPFLLVNNLEIKKQCVTFLDKIPTNEELLNVKALVAPEEEIIIKKNIAYLYCPNGFGRTKLSNSNIEKKLKSSATSRNWNTISKLYNLSHTHLE